MYKVKTGVKMLKIFYYYACNKDFKNNIWNVENNKSLRNKLLYNNINAYRTKNVQKKSEFVLNNKMNEFRLKKKVTYNI